MVIHLVNSLETIGNHLLNDGAIFALPNGEIYQYGKSDELGGIGSFFKKLGVVALGAAGAIAAPFTGGASLALIGVAGSIGSGLLASGGGGANAKNQPSGLPEAITVFSGEADVLIGQLPNNANIETTTAAIETKRNALHAAINQLWNIKHHVEQPKTLEYHTATDAVRTKWDAAVVVELARRSVAAQKPQTVVNPGGGQTTTTGGNQTAIVTTGGNQTTTNSGNNQNSVAPNSFLSGVDNSTLLVGAAIFGLVFLLKS